jgi:hypothetical protein
MPIIELVTIYLRAVTEPEILDCGGDKVKHKKNN